MLNLTNRIERGGGQPRRMGMARNLTNRIERDEILEAVNWLADKPESNQ